MGAAEAPPPVGVKQKKEEPPYDWSVGEGLPEHAQTVSARSSSSWSPPNRNSPTARASNITPSRVRRSTCNSRRACRSFGGYILGKGDARVITASGLSQAAAVHGRWRTAAAQRRPQRSGRLAQHDRHEGRDRPRSPRTSCSIWVSFNEGTYAKPSLSLQLRRRSHRRALHPDPRLPAR